MIDTTRYIVLKISVNEQEADAIRKSCTAMRKSVSAAGRDLLLRQTQPSHRIRRAPRREGPRLGPSLAEMFPARRGGGAMTPLRL